MSIVQGQQYQAQQAAQFAQSVGQLQKGGLNATSLNQIIQGGASSGLPIAQGIQGGGKQAIQQLNAIQAQIQSSAAKLGDAGGPAMYQAGVAAGQGLAQGIKSQLGSVDSAIQQLAQSITNSIKKALHISSPSQVFAGFGMALPQGLAQGVDAGSAVAEAAVSRMGNRAAGAYHPGAFSGGGSGGSGSGTVINVTMHVQGSVMSENDLVSTVQNGLLKQGLQNWRTGIVPQGRAA